MNPINFTTIADLGRDVLTLAAQLPPGIGAVVGVGRSGLLPATLLATHLHLPLCEAESFIKTAEPCGAGKRLDCKSGIPDGSLLLIVEDAIVSGRGIDTIVARLVNERPELVDRIYTASVYVTSAAMHRVNFHARIMEAPRWFQWNWLNQGSQRYAAWDLDGALCVDPTVKDADEGGYEFAITNAAPLYLPRRFEIPLIVTNRLERHRLATEQWLRRHGVRWRRLVMDPADTALERSKVEGYPFKRKADEYAADESLRVFIESHNNQAKQIYAATGKPVFCTSTLTIYQ